MSQASTIEAGVSRVRGGTAVTLPSPVSASRRVRGEGEREHSSGVPLAERFEVGVVGVEIGVAVCVGVSCGGCVAGGVVAVPAMHDEEEHQQGGCFSVRPGQPSRDSLVYEGVNAEGEAGCGEVVDKKACRDHQEHPEECVQRGFREDVECSSRVIEVHGQRV